MLKRVVELGGNAPSFGEASKQLRRNVSVAIGAKETQRLTEHIGRDWAQARDEQVEQFKQGTLPRLHGQGPQVAAVMVDGGRTQIRASEQEPGVHQPAWREVKYANLTTLASRISSIDPQAEPPSKFLDPERVKKVVEQVHDQHVPGKPRGSAKPSKRKPARKRLKRRILRLVTTFVATMGNAEQFGYMVAAEAFQRGLDLAERKAYICDGLPYNWTIYEDHFRQLGFVPILDFLHLLGYLYAAAHALEEVAARAWQRYAEWLRWAWSGQRAKLLSALQAASAKLGLPPAKAPEQDRRVIVARAATYVANNYDRIDYPRYRKLGLPCSSAPMESAVKQFSRRVKGSEKFWVEEGSEAVLQVRAASLSQDDRMDRLWSRPHSSHAYGSNWRKIAA